MNYLIITLQVYHQVFCSIRGEYPCHCRQMYGLWPEYFECVCSINIPPKSRMCSEKSRCGCNYNMATFLFLFFT